MHIDFDIKEWLKNNDELIAEVILENICNPPNKTSEALSKLIEDIKAANKIEITFGIALT